MSGRAAHVEDIQDEEFNARLKAIDDEDDWKSEDDEKYGSEEDDSEGDDSDEEITERGLTIPQETIWERISALRDIIPPSTRRSISQKVNSITGYGGVTLLWSGRAAWVLTTTLLLWGLPYSLAVEDEMRITQQERDLNSQQHGAQSVSSISRMKSRHGHHIEPLLLTFLSGNFPSNRCSAVNLLPDSPDKQPRKVKMPVEFVLLAFDGQMVQCSDPDCIARDLVKCIICVQCACVSLFYLLSLSLSFLFIQSLQK